MKYLTDGRKVAVIGNLNSKEIIVQEIFISEDGSEIPAGENFIVRSVLDEPLETWHQKQARDYKQELDRIQAQYEKASADLAQHQRLAAAKVKALKGIASNVVAEQLETLEAFVAGGIKYLVAQGYSGVKVQPFSEVVDVNDRDYPGIKLVSLFGDSNGDLSYKVNYYKDGSGDWTDVYPCQDLAEAQSTAQRLYDAAVKKWQSGKSNYPPKNDFAQGVEIELHPDAMRFWEDSKINQKQKRIKELEDQLAALRAE